MADMDPYDVLASLGMAGCTDATRIHGGWDTTIWKVACQGKHYALRLYRPGRMRAARHEVAMIRAAAAAGVEVPEIHAEGVWEDRPAMLLSWCDGRPLMQEMRRRPWNIRELGYRFGQRQAVMHQLDVDVPGVGAHDWITMLGPIDETLHAGIVNASSTSCRLLHLDYHPLNVMVMGRRIGCILDWTNSSIGDPRADVARTWSILRLMPLTPGRPEPVTEAARRLLAAGWLRGYEDVAGPLQNMVIFKAWAAAAMVVDMQKYVDEPDNRTTPRRPPPAPRQPPPPPGRT